MNGCGYARFGAIIGILVGVGLMVLVQWLV